MVLNISIKKVAIWLAVVILSIHAIGFAGRTAEHFCGYSCKETTAFVHLFHPADEANLLSWISSLLLAVCSVLLALIAYETKNRNGIYVKHWKWLALIFLYISIDETAALHEMTILPLRHAFNAGGIFYWSWVIIAIPIVLILSVVYFRFWIRLPPKIRAMVFAAGFIYVGGALGLEMVGAYVTSTGFGKDYHLYSLIMTAEELMENTGTAVFIVALLSYLQLEMKLNSIALNWSEDFLPSTQLYLPRNIPVYPLQAKAQKIVDLHR